MQTLPLACFLSLIRPPGVQFESALLQPYMVDKNKCPFVLDGKDITFQLYTRHNPLNPQYLAVDDDESLFASSIDFHDPTVLFFHAFMETPDDGSALLIREAYMQRGDTNLVVVDAQSLEAGPWYFTAADNTWYIGRLAALFIDYLVSRGLDLSNTHLVGHSLGAQSAGVAGGTLKSGRVSRITGLDPAWPVFCKLPLERRLDTSDADFVDVIHTDAGIFGFKYAIGHVDFFPNGGKSPQPGCELEFTLPQQLLLNNFFCSHWRSYRFYSESVVRPQAFVASECPSWRKYTLGDCARSNRTHMGFAVDRQGTNVTLCLHAVALKENTLQMDIRHVEMARFLKELTNESNGIRTNTRKRDAKYNISNIFKTIRLHQLKSIKSQKRKLALFRTTDRTPKDSTQQLHRERRFIPFWKSEASDNDNFLFRIMEFLFKNRKSVVPIVTVMREINTLVKSTNGELSHLIKERNNYIGTPPPPQPLTYNLALDNNSKLKSFVKKLFGLTQGDNLSITST